MKNIVKSRKEDEDSDASSSFSHFSEEIILKILNKLFDLKTLCCCYLVSKRFSSIVLQVDAISFTSPPRIPDNNTAINRTSSPPEIFSFYGELPLTLPLPPQLFSFYGESFPSAIRFMSKFKGVKSLCIELPSSREIGIDTNCLFKWKVKFGNRVESFLFLAFNSICDKDGFHVDGIKDQEENAELYKQKSETCLQCFKDVAVRHMLLCYLIKDLPMLEEVSITDRERRGKLSLSGGKQLSEVGEWLHTLASESVYNRVEIPYVMGQWDIDLLNLPGSGNVMKEVYCVHTEIDGVEKGGNDGILNSEIGFEGKEGALYTEALKEILANWSD